MSTLSLRYDATGLRTKHLGESLGIDLAQRQSHKGELEAAIQAVDDAHKDGTLGFLTCIDDDVLGMEQFAERILQAGQMTDQLVIGIGGSSLGARAVLASASDEQLAGLRTHFSENIDPVSWRRLLGQLDLSTTLIIVITKSGSTIETMGKFWIAYAALIDAFGEEQAAKHVVAITDPERGGLRALADAKGFHSFSVPPHVGGRFSVLTPVGLLPLALAGYPIRRLLNGARLARETSQTQDALSNACAMATLDQVLLAKAGVDQVVMMSYSDLLGPLVDWFVQLWAESLGKVHPETGQPVGITPIKALGVVDQHSQVQLFMEGPANKHVTFLRVANHWDDDVVPQMEGLPNSLKHLQGKKLSELMEAELQGTYHALLANARPVSIWHFEQVDPEHVGAFILSWEYITALAGQLMGINAFDQPGVELGKLIAHGLLGRQDCIETSERYVSDAESERDVFDVALEV